MQTEAQADGAMKGTVARIVGYGAFIQLADGRTGLLHISEISDIYVSDVRDFLVEGDPVRVVVLGQNEHGRLELSARKISPLRKKTTSNGHSSNSSRELESPGNFEQKLHRFMKQSEERLLDLKRNTESKRGGGHRRR